MKKTAEFISPFTGVLPYGKTHAMTPRELERAIRQSLAAEEEAVHLYEAIADASANEFVSKVMQDVADEEKVHAGEFQRLLDILAPQEEKFISEGKEEVDEMAEKKGVFGMDEKRVASELVKLAKQIVSNQPTNRRANVRQRTAIDLKRDLDTNEEGIADMIYGCLKDIDKDFLSVEVKAEETDRGWRWDDWQVDEYGVEFSCDSVKTFRLDKVMRLFSQESFEITHDGELIPVDELLNKKTIAQFNKILSKPREADEDGFYICDDDVEDCTGKIDSDAIYVIWSAKISGNKFVLNVKPVPSEWRELEEQLLEWATEVEIERCEPSL